VAFLSDRPLDAGQTIVAPRKSPQPHKEKKTQKTRFKKEEQIEQKEMKMEKGLLCFSQVNGYVSVFVFGCSHLDFARRLLYSSIPNFLVYFFTYD
jgi:hypothetical protein